MIFNISTNNAQLKKTCTVMLACSFLSSTGLQALGDDNEEGVSSDLVKRSAQIVQLTPQNEVSLKEMPPSQLRDVNLNMSSFNEMVIPKGNLFVPHTLEDAQVSYSDGDFYVIRNDSQIKVNRYDLSKELRGITSDKLEGFLEVGYLSLKKVENDYSIQSHLRLLGGGPLFGLITGIGVVAGIFTSAVVSVVIPPAAPAGAAVCATLAATAPATITAAFLAPTP